MIQLRLSGWAKKELGFKREAVCVQRSSLKLKGSSAHRHWGCMWLGGTDTVTNPGFPVVFTPPAAVRKVKIKGRRLLLWE